MANCGSCAHLAPATGPGTVDLCGQFVGSLGGAAIGRRDAPRCMGRDYFPRRARTDLHTPAEALIRAALVAVEALGADVRLTDTVIMLGHAASRLADYIENAPSREITGLPAREARAAPPAA